MGRAGKLLVTFIVLFFVVVVLGAIFGSGYFVCGLLQSCPGEAPRSFLAHLLEPLLGYGPGIVVAHLVDITKFTVTVGCFVLVAWMWVARGERRWATGRAGKLLLTFIVLFFVVVVLGPIFGPGYFVCGLLQGCPWDTARSFFAHLLEPVFGYGPGILVAHLVDITPFTVTIGFFVFGAWIWVARGVTAQRVEETKELAALNRCDVCKTAVRDFYYLTKVEGKGFLCKKCLQALEGTPQAE